MNIFFYCKWINKDEWLTKIKKKFKNHKILTLSDKPDFEKIECAIIWEIPDKLLEKMKNLKLIFSMGAGVDHILNLTSYKNVPIIRLKDPLMAERMANHVISQILNFQLYSKYYQKFQNERKWAKEKQTTFNSSLTIGILGLGYLGKHVAKILLKLGYKVIAFKKNKIKNELLFKIYYKKHDLKKFVLDSNIIVNILPSTEKTKNFIDINFLKKMKKNSLLINVGRGTTIKEKDLISHMKKNKNFFASLDVFNNEPLKKNNKLWDIPNLTITPHVASITIIDSAIEFMYSEYNYFSKNKYIKTDVDKKKGY